MALQTTVQAFELVAHPAHPPLQVSGIIARVDASDPNWLRLRWTVTGARQVISPPFAGRHRADELWRATCFELFIASSELAAGAYEEYNFSASEAWAAYAFQGRRSGMAERPIAREPVCTWRSGNSGIAIFDVAIPSNQLLAFPWSCGITAVIEETGGVKSYWALAHNGDEPDFHDPACFSAGVEPTPHT